MPQAKIRIGGQWVPLGVTSTDVQNTVTQATNNLIAKLNNVNEYLTNGTFSNGMINVVEARKIGAFLKAVDTAKADLDQRYNVIYSNPKLSSQTKTNLSTQKATTDAAYTTLENTINQIITAGTASSTDQANVESQFTTFKNNVSLLSSLLTSAEKEITDGLDTRLTAAEANISTALTDINNVQSYVDGNFKTGIVYDSQYRVVQGYLNTLAADKAKIDNEYNQVYSNTNLTDPEKTNLSTAKSNVDSAYNSLINTINTAIADQQVTPTEKTSIDNAFTTYQNNLGVYATSLQAAKYKITSVTATTTVAATNSQQQIMNSTFISGYNGGWTQWDTAWSVDTTTLYEGVNTAKASRTGQGSVSNAYIASNYVPCSPNMYFTLSAFVQTNSTAGIDSPVYMDLQWTDNSNNQLATNSVVITPSQNNTWQYFTVTGQAPANTAKVRARFYLSKNGTIWIAKPMLQIGQIATSHTEFALYSKQWSYQGSPKIDGSNIQAGTITFDQAYGGTIKLGGAQYGNAALYMYSSTGDTMVAIDVNNRGFDYINVGRINSDYVVKRDPDLFKNGPVTLYVDPVNGSDTNDGKTTSTQMKTIQHALDSLPKYLNQDVTITVKAGSGTIYEYLTIHGFYGRGNLTLEFTGFANVLVGTIEVYNCGSQIGIYDLKIAYPNLNTTGASVIYVHNSMVEFYNCQIYGRGVAQYCLRAKYGSRIRCREVSFYDAERGMDLEYASYGAFWNTYGNPTYYAAVYSSEILAYGSKPNGTTIETEGGNVQWYTTPEPSSGTTGSYSPPYTLGSGSRQTTTQFTPTGGDSWRTVYSSWRRDGTVRQGQWSGYGVHQGYWFFGTSVSSAVTGKTIVGMRVYLNRLSQGGYSSGVPVYIHHHGLTALPSNDNQPSYSTEYATDTLSWGQSKWITLPSSFYSYFQSGTSNGICVYTTDSSNAGYAMFDPSNMILEITYQG